MCHTASSIDRRAGGRRPYNLWRKMNAAARRLEVAKQLAHGAKQSDIARALRVDRATISQGVDALLQKAQRDAGLPGLRQHI